MSDSEKDKSIFTSAAEDLESSVFPEKSPQTLSRTYRLAYDDVEFLLRDELRAVRLQLELLKPDLIQREAGVEATVVIFGSARIPEPGRADRLVEEARGRLRENPSDPHLIRGLDIARRRQEKAGYYEEAHRLASLITGKGGLSLVVVTGGGPGIMEAANRGAVDAGGPSVGLNIALPGEQAPNRFITPELCFQFHYFAIRKMHFLLRAKALVIFPGGFGTLDELFDALTLIQTMKIKPMPVLLFGREYWQRVIDFGEMANEGMIADEDVKLFRYVNTAQEAWDSIRDHYQAG